MLKIIIRTMCLLLALCCLLTACQNAPEEVETGDAEKNDSIPEAVGTVNDYTEHQVSGTVHLGYEDLKDEGIPFVVDGKTEYKIVYDGNNTFKTEAALFFCDQIRNATGASIEKEDNPVWSETAKYIVIGDKDMVNAAGIERTDIALGVSGYQLVTKGNSLFMIVDGVDGYQMGTLALLKILVGYIAIDADIIVYEKEGSYIPEMNIIEIPDFQYRNNREFFQHAEDRGYSMGTITEAYMFISVEGETFHNELNYLNPDVYEAEHPKWYTEKRKSEPASDPTCGVWPAHLCHTARGDEAEFALMCQTIADKIVAYALDPANEERRIITVTQEDESYHCPCEACSAIEEEYGSPAAPVIMFVNAIDDIVQAKLQEHADATGTDKRQLKILFFAYQDTRFPPTKIDEKVTCNENVGIYYAASKVRWSWSLNDEINAQDAEALKEWGKFGELYVYGYRHNTDNYFLPCNTYRSVVENFRFLKGVNTTLIGEESNAQYHNTAFYTFKDYLYSTLVVNVNTSYEEMKETYFKYQYGAGGEYMEQFFDEMVEYMDVMRLKGDYNFYGVCVNESVCYKEYWPYQMMQGWLELCDKALDAIEPTKISDPKMYQIYYDHIMLETIFPRYVLCKLHQEQFSDEDLFAMRKELYIDCKYFDMLLEGYYRTPLNASGGLWEAWGVK